MSQRPATPWDNPMMMMDNNRKEALIDGNPKMMIAAEL